MPDQLRDQSSQPVGWSLIHEIHGNRGDAVVHLDDGRIIGGYVQGISNHDFTLTGREWLLVVPWGQVTAVFSA